MEVALLAERRYLTQRQPLGLAAELRRRGCEVALVDPGAGALDLTDGAWPVGVEPRVATLGSRARAVRGAARSGAGVSQLA
jgi:hypothetical protein